MTITTENSVTGIDDQLNVEKNQPLLVALDVDGTLVNHRGEMSEAVRAAAQSAAAAGNHLVIATGRSLGATLPVAQELGIERGYCVSSNGGVTVRLDPDLPNGFEVVDKATFDPAPALLAVRKALPGALFALETEDGEFLSMNAFQDASFGVTAREVSFEDMLHTQAVRVVVFSTDTSAEEFGEAVSAIGLHGVTYSVGWTAWLDIAAQGVTKATALEGVRDRLDITEDATIAIGDGRNDVEMLEWAGCGVAMGQAPDEVKDVANLVTDTVENDGAARVLEQLATVQRTSQGASRRAY